MGDPWPKSEKEREELLAIFAKPVHDRTILETVRVAYGPSPWRFAPGDPRGADPAQNGGVTTDSTYRLGILPPRTHVIGEQPSEQMRPRSLDDLNAALNRFRAAVARTVVQAKDVTGMTDAYRTASDKEATERLKLIHTALASPLRTKGLNRPDVIDYVMHYGGRCRDCADENGICPHLKLPCDSDEARPMIEAVLAAVEYGLKHGYIS